MSDDGHVEQDEILDPLVSRADLDALVRLVDERCTARDWPGLLRLRDRSRAAVRTGRQLWPAATLAEYRLALLGPPDLVAVVLNEEGTGRFALGPLTEVAAQRHTWAELAPHLDPGPRAALVAHERVLHGEVIDPASVAGLPDVLELPGALQPWEPAYPLAEYLDSEARFPSPPPPSLPAEATELPSHDDIEVLLPGEWRDVAEAMQQLVLPWVTGSNGRLDAVAAEGGPLDALAALGLRRARLVELSPADALAWLAWAGASGGAHGTRRGAAAGRSGAWWLLGALGGLAPDDVVTSDELGAIAHELRWWWWDAGEPVTGWRVQLAVEDPLDAVSWALSAHDAT